MAAKKTTKKTAKKKAAAKKKPAAKKPAAKKKPASRRVFKNSNKRAIGGSSKSGYAKDIMPERVESSEKEGLTVPVGTENGCQDGKPSPAQRVYGANYKAVTLAEAQANLTKRSRGEMDIIHGGLDDDMTADEHEDQITAQENYDPLGGELDGDTEPGSAELLAEERKLAAAAPIQPAASVQRAVAPAAPVVEASPKDAYLAQRTRITLELVDGAMSMAAIDTKESKYGITILLPLQDEGATFIPKPGSEITVVKGDQRWKCFFPGTYFEAPELGILGIVFVKAEES